MNIEIANRLVELRKSRGLSQDELASVIGVSRQAVSKWECAEACPDMDKAIALSRFYGITLDELFGNRPQKTVPAPEALEAVDENVGESEDASKESMDTVPELTDAGEFTGVRNINCSMINYDLQMTGVEGSRGHIELDGAEADLSRCRFHISGDTLYVEEKREERRFFELIGSMRRGGRIRLYVPSKLDTVDITLKGGDLKLDSINAARLNSTTGGGDVSANEICAGDIRMVSGGGDISVHGFIADETASISTGGGDIKAVGAARRFVTKSGGGDIAAQLNADSVEAASGGGDIALECTGAKFISAKTGGGDISTHLSKCSGLNASVATVGGDAYISYNGTKIFEGKKANVMAGDGSTRLELHSAGGDIEVNANNRD